MTQKIKRLTSALLMPRSNYQYLRLDGPWSAYTTNWWHADFGGRAQAQNGGATS